MKRVWVRFAGPLFVLFVFLAALLLLHQELKQYHLRDFLAALQNIRPLYLVMAIGLTILNYVVLIGYDWVGLRFIGQRMSAKRIALVAFLGNAVGNNFGSLLGGSGVRYRLYSGFGLSATEIVRLVMLLSITFWIGLLGISGITMTIDPAVIPDRLGLPIATSSPIGIFFCLITAAYLTASAKQFRVRIRDWVFTPPPLKLAVVQYAVSALDFTIAAAVLYSLLPVSLTVGFWHFLAIFLLAVVLSVLSTVPGGFGVFELTIIVLLEEADTHELVGALLAFRVIYYLIPLAFGLLLITANEVAMNRKRIGGAMALSRKWSGIITPRILALTVFVAGVVLLISGATPASEGRMGLLRRILPLPAIELSHFLGSVLGVLLLVLARGIQRRIETAWYLTMALLAGGIITSMIKGIDWEESVLLGAMFLALLPTRSHFFRHGSLLRTRFTPGWFVAILIVLGLTVWIMFFAYKHVEYKDEIWWQFAFDANAPRSLRAIVGAVLVTLFLAVGRLTSSRGRLAGLPDENDTRDALAIVERAPAGVANLARLGDKRFLFNDQRTAFVMYGEEGRCLIAMGDPVGPEEAARDLIWDFIETCDVGGWIPVFYQIDEDRATMYAESGMTLLKIGEEARVPLKNFNLEGKKRADLRRSDRKMTDAGCTFEVVPRGQVSAIMPRLKEVSDAWLGDKGAGEKSFSLGFFKPDYIETCPIAVVRREGEIIAFANIWECAQVEITVDLMRFVPDSPNGLMDYLFMKLMVWGHEQGYEYFGLGMAPLAGIESRSGSPIWNKVADLTYRHGEHFYNFRGLRSYKDKFDPVWRPKYVASPGGMKLPIVLANLTTLISGGMTRLLTR